MNGVIDQYIGRNFAFYNGDSCEVLKNLPDDSIHFSIFSPPFVDLYTYSDSDRDLGNCKSNEEFDIHLGFIARELYRIMMPGRIIAVHCMDMPAQKFKDGFIGAKDFPGELINVFTGAGFYFHSRICIWKNPVTAMQRTKALGLLHKQLKKDACMSRQGFADYVVVFRKPGENPEPVTNTNETFPVELWQKYASPVWDDINQSYTLQASSARDEKDEKHICPLQLDVIERCIKLWTNPGDTVLTPFGGIGSEVYEALKMGRKGIGIELKSVYFQQAVKNCINAESLEQQSLFDDGGLLG